MMKVMREGIGVAVERLRLNASITDDEEAARVMCEVAESLSALCVERCEGDCSTCGECVGDEDDDGNETGDMGDIG